MNRLYYKFLVNYTFHYHIVPINKKYDTYYYFIYMLVKLLFDFIVYFLAMKNFSTMLFKYLYRF